MLKVNIVSKTIGNKIILENCKFEVSKGEIFGIFGPSGVGKTTLLKILTGIDRKYEGDIVYNTVNNSASAYVPQENALFPWRTVQENLELSILLSHQTINPYKQKLIKKILQDVNLENHSKLFSNELSGGMKQRAALGFALASEPEIVFLDEPFSALDQQNKITLQKLLLDIRKEYKCTMVIISHDINELESLCNRILLLKGSPGTIEKIVENGTNSPLKQKILQFM